MVSYLGIVAFATFAESRGNKRTYGSAFQTSGYSLLNHRTLWRSIGGDPDFHLWHAGVDRYARGHAA